MAATQPNIIARAAWGSSPVVCPADTISVPTDELWLHHTASEEFGAAGMRMLQSFTEHRTDARYVDLEYTFVYDDNNNQLFESRGVGRNTAATGGWTGLPFLSRRHNSISHAICVMGNFQTQLISDAAIEVLANLVAWGYERGWWKTCGFTGGHRDASGNKTACPGDHLEAQIARINARALEIHTATPTPTPIQTGEDVAVFVDEIHPGTSSVEPKCVDIDAAGNIFANNRVKLTHASQPVVFKNAYGRWVLPANVPSDTTYRGAVARTTDGKCSGFRQFFVPADSPIATRDYDFAA